MVGELRNLGECGKGVHKRWIWAERKDFDRICDYLQKIGNSIQDLNWEISFLDKPTMKDVIFVIVLVDWICEAFEILQRFLRPALLNDFTYQKEAELQQAKRYFKALRSFVVAHPLSTNRHNDYGFDGDFICVDTVAEIPSFFADIALKRSAFYVDYMGLHRWRGGMKADFFLCSYSKRIDEMKFYKHIGCSFADIYRVAELHIDKLYALDKHLSKKKKKDFGV